MLYKLFENCTKTALTRIFCKTKNKLIIFMITFCKETYNFGERKLNKTRENKKHFSFSIWSFNFMIENSFEISENLFLKYLLLYQEQ